MIAFRRLLAALLDHIRPRRQDWIPFNPSNDQALWRSALLTAAAEHGPEKVIEAIERGDFQDRYIESIREAASDGAGHLIKRCKTAAPAMRRRRKSTTRGFQDRLYDTWERPLDALEMVIVFAEDTLGLFDAQWPWQGSVDHDLVYDILRQLHARGCQIAHEIEALLRAGYAPGAHARWRTLHETAVTAMFIAKHGKDVAERYLLHKEIRVAKEAEEYQAHCSALGQSPHSEEYMNHLSAISQHLEDRFGKGFSGLYGWAAEALGEPKNTHLGFKQIEEAIQFDHWRPWYQMASHPSHANAQAITSSLAVPPGQQRLLTGGSNVGLAEPGHSTAISLLHLTQALVFTRPSMDALVTSKAMAKLVDEVGKAFAAAHQDLMARSDPEPPESARATGFFFQTIVTRSKPDEPDSTPPK